MYPSWYLHDSIARVKSCGTSPRTLMEIKSGVAVSQKSPGRILYMAGVDHFSINWPRRHNLGPGR